MSFTIQNKTFSIERTENIVSWKGEISGKANVFEFKRFYEPLITSLSYTDYCEEGEDCSPFEFIEIQRIINRDVAEAYSVKANPELYTTLSHIIEHILFILNSESEESRKELTLSLVDQLQ